MLRLEKLLISYLSKKSSDKEGDYKDIEACLAKSFLEAWVLLLDTIKLDVMVLLE